MTPWPDVLPLPQIAGYRLADADPVMRSSIDTGPAQARQRNGHDAQQAPLTLVLSDLQLAAFDAFYVETLGCGAAWFALTLRNASGTGLRMCRITGGYKAVRSAPGSWTVTATIVVDLPRQVAA